jgi:hypothetical protein
VTKVCTKCGETKGLEEFGFKTKKHLKYRSDCKACASKSFKRWSDKPENREYQKTQSRREWLKRYHQRPEIRARRSRQRAPQKLSLEAREKARLYSRQWYSDPENKAKADKRGKLRREIPENKEKQRAYLATRYDNRKKIARTAIYSITNTINGSVYIGQTKMYSRRCEEHKRRLSHNNHPNHHLLSDYNNHGQKAFEFKVIEELPSDTDRQILLEKEKNTIRRYLVKGIPLYNT